MLNRTWPCPDCEANHRPAARWPSAVPKAYHFNHVVGVDLVKTRSPFTKTEEWWANVVCWVTGFQQVWRLGANYDHVDSTAAENVWAAFVKYWTRVFGEAEIFVVDPGLGFAGYLAEMPRCKRIVLLPTDARTPWENGRTERAGGEWERQSKIAMHRDGH